MAAVERRMEENKELVRRDNEAVWNGGDLDAIDEYVADEFVLHDPSVPGEFRGPEGYREFVAMYRGVFPDTHIAIEELVAEGDVVATRWTGTGTHEGEFVGIEPTGAAVEITGTTFVRVEDGEFVELWESYDALGMLGQIGALPEEFAE